MNIAVDAILLEDLYHKKRLSAHTFHCCRDNRLRSLKDLRNSVTSGRYKYFHRCGPIARKEMETLARMLAPAGDDGALKSNHEIIDYLYPLRTSLTKVAAEVFEVKASEFPEKLRHLFLKLFPDVKEFLYAMLDNNSLIFLEKELGKPGDVYEVQKLCVAMLGHLRQAISAAVKKEPAKGSDDEFTIALLERRDEELRKSIGYCRLAYNIAMFSPAKMGLLEKEYQNALASLSNRSLHIVEGLDVDCRKIVHFLSAGNDNLGRVKNCGAISRMEILDVFSRYVRSIDEISEMSLSETEHMSALHKYPFLNDKECSEFNEFTTREGYVPMFRLAIKFFKHTPHRDDKIYAMYYGIATKKLDKASLAEMFSLSKENVRLILVNRRVSKALGSLLASENWRQYPFLNQPVIDATEVAASILPMECEGEEVDENAIFGLLTLHGYSRPYRVNERIFMVATNLMEVFDFGRFFSDINECYSRRRRRNQFRHEDMLEKYREPGRIFNPDVVSDVARAVIVRSGVGYVDKEGVITINPNSVDVFEEIYNILDANGEPMHITSIFDEFKRRHPDHRFSKPQNLRSYLLLSDRIRPIGLTSTYALDKWSHIETLSIRDSIHDILQHSDVPLSVSVIYEELYRRGRPSTKNSISTSITTDGKKRFVRFEKGLIGVNGKSYPDKYKPVEPRVVARRPFDHNLVDYFNFIDVNGRQPLYNDDLNEGRLKRWYANVMAGRIECSPEQMKHLTDELEKRKSYLMTAREYSFLCRCNEIRDFVARYMTLPDVHHNLHLYMWFCQKKRTALQLKDRRREFFHDLLKELKEQGLI